jgi:hypothetical protein
VGTLSLYAASINQSLEAGGVELAANQQEELRVAACRNGEVGNCVGDSDEMRLIHQAYRRNAYTIAEVLAATFRYKLEVTLSDINKKQADDAVCYDILVMQNAAQKLCNYFLGPDEAAKGGCGDPLYTQAIKDGRAPPKLPPFRNFLDDEEEGFDNRVRAINEKTKELVGSIYCKNGTKMKIDRTGAAQAFEILIEAGGDVATHATDVLKAITARDVLKAVGKAK